MNPPSLLAFVALLASATMTGVFLRSRRTGRVAVVDVVWSVLVGIVAVGVSLAATGDWALRLATASIGAVWSIRLASHLATRVRHEAEDGRYEAMLRAIGDRAAPLFAFFQMQAVSVVVFALPFVAAASNPHRASVAIPLALGIALVAIVGESVADRQLAAHRTNPAMRGITCRVGLWGWSRHPNYFFEWLHWFAYLPLAYGGPWAAAALVGPVAMGLFLYRVSGIPWVEAQAIRSRGDDYRAYQREVSAFFPLPPRRTVAP